MSISPISSASSSYMDYPDELLYEDELNRIFSRPPSPVDDDLSEEDYYSRFDVYYQEIFDEIIARVGMCLDRPEEAFIGKLLPFLQQHPDQLTPNQYRAIAFFLRGGSLNECGEKIKNSSARDLRSNLSLYLN